MVTRPKSQSGTAHYITHNVHHLVSYILNRLRSSTISIIIVVFVDQIKQKKYVAKPHSCLMLQFYELRSPPTFTRLTCTNSQLHMSSVV